MIEQSESIKHLAVALAKSHLKIKNPIKDKNGMHNSKYATLQACINITREILAENGLSVIQLPTKSENESGIATMLLHESGEYIRTTYTFQMNGSNAQALGSLFSYLRRYSLMATLNISAEDDDDDADSIVDNKNFIFNNGQNIKTTNNSRQNSSAVLASQSQKNYLRTLMGKDEYEQNKNFIENEMTKEQASEKIKHFMGEKKNG